MPQGDELGSYIRAYIGPNASFYEKAIQDQTSPNPPAYKLGWSWGGFLLYWAWTGYRKLLKLTLLLIGCEFLLSFLSEYLPFLALLVAVVLWLGVVLLGKNHYVSVAKYEVKLILLSVPDHELALKTIRKKGGVSIPFGILCGLIIAVKFYALYLIVSGLLEDLVL